jgi:hypothetical protein
MCVSFLKQFKRKVNETFPEVKMLDEATKVTRLGRWKEEVVLEEEAKGEGGGDAHPFTEHYQFIMLLCVE